MSNEIIVPKKTVDDYLNEVDYTGINTYIPSQFALDLVNLIKLIEGGEPENKTPPVHYKFIDTLVTEGDTVNMCHRGFAKALSLDTKVFTDTGVTTIKDIKVGDTIFGEDGKLTTITHKSEVFNKPMYRLTLSDGRTLDVSEDHINVILRKKQKRVKGKRVNYVERQEVTTKELLKIKLSSTRAKTKKNPLGKENLVWIPTNAPIAFSEKDLPLDPYTVGLLLGDGCLTSSIRFCSHVNDFEFYKTKVPYEWGASNLKDNTITIGIKGISKEVKALGLNCHGNLKRVPANYLYGSIPQRLELLKGLMDTDGTVYKNGACSFTSNSKGLVEDVMFLVRSLGGVATISSTGKAWRTRVSLNEVMFGLPRKAERQKLNSKTKVALESIELIEQVPSQCIAVDNSSHTFIAGDFVVTHNTTVKEYLMWYIAIFGTLPGIGKIPYALYVSDSMDNGVKKMRRSMEGRWDNSPFLQKYVPKAKFTDIIWDFTNASGNRFVVTGHGAQALSLDSTLLTASGRTTMGDCKVGDYIYGPEGVLSKIVAKSDIFYKPMYELELEDGRKLKVSEDHINSVMVKENFKNRAVTVDKDLTTKELLELPLTFDRVKKYKEGTRISSEKLIHVRNSDALIYPDKDLPIDAYTLGVILGDGRIRKECGSVELTAHVDDFAHYYKNIPYEFGTYRKDLRSNAATQSIRGLGKLLKELKLNVHGKYKFIPQEYFYGSIEQRLNLLQGLMDTDGTISVSGRSVFCSQSSRLCADVANLTRSLGGSAKIYKCNSKDMFRVELWLDKPMFKIPRKLERFKPRTKHMALKSISKIAMEPSQCIAIDSVSHQYLANDYFRTHNTGVRGTRENNSRPVLALLDDLISDTDAKSPTVIQNVKDTIYKAIFAALHPTKRKIIWSGTPFNANDPLYQAVESGAWNVNVFPVCERFPCSKEDFRGSWEDRFTYESTKQAYNLLSESGNLEAFNQELMLRIMSEDDKLIEDTDIQWYDYSLLMKNLQSYNIYITTDFATSEKTSADFSVISVWAINNKGHWFWIDGICKRQQMDANLDDLFRLVQIYNPLSVGIEVSGQQGGFVSLIQRAMIDKNIFFNLASESNNGKPGIRPNKQKFTRFLTILPWFKSKIMFFPEQKKDSAPMQEAMNELGLVSKHGFKSKHDDFIDTISMLSLMNAWRPTADIQMKYNDTSGLWEEDSYEYEVSNLDSYLV